MKSNTPVQSDANLTEDDESDTPLPGGTLAIADGDPRTGNTGVSTIQTPSSLGEPSQPSGGCDYLELSVYGQWSESRWDDFVAAMDASQNLALQDLEAGGEGRWFHELPEGEAAMMHATGFGKGVRCKWRLTVDGITIGIVNRRDYLDGHPSVRLSIPSMPLMIHGEDVCVERLLSTLRSLGLDVVDLGVPSRVDVCIDLPGVDVDPVTRAAAAGGVIKRARSTTYHQHGNRMTGFEAGASQCRIRAYDKLTETEHQPDKRQVMVERRWGGITPNHATRVEFQLRANYLRKRFQVTSYEEWKAQRTAIVDYLTTEWIRLVEQFDRDNEHHSRAVDTPFWQKVCDAFRDVFGTHEGITLRPLKRAPKAVEPLLKQVAGCLASIRALIEPDDGLGAPGVLRSVCDLLAPELDRIDEATRTKRRLFDVLRSMPPPCPVTECPF